MPLGDNIGTMFVSLGADISDFQKKMDKAGTKMQAAGQKMTDVGKNMTAKVTAPIALIGGLMLKSAGDFEAGMNKVQALTSASTEEFNALEAQAKKLGATTQFSASQAADAMGFLGMAGFDANQILGSMEATLNLAAAAQLNLGEAADVVSNIMTGYGLETDQAGRATDVLTKAFTSANTDLSQLGEAMKFVGPVASTVGISFEETAAAIGLMGNAGIQGGMAGTSLRGVLSRLVNQSGPATDSMLLLAEGYKKATGESLKNADGTDANVTSFLKAGSPIQNLTQLVDFMAKAQRGLGDDAAFTGELMTIFGQRAGPSMAALVTQGSEALGDMTTKLEESGGAAATIADVQMQGFNGAMKALTSAFEAVQIAVAQSGLLEFATDFGNGLATLLRRLAATNPAMLNMGVIVAAVVAAIGPLLLIVGPLTTGLGIVTTAFAGLTLTAGLWIAGIIAAIAIGVLLVKNWEAITGFITSKFGPQIEAIKEAFVSFGRTITDVWDSVGPDILSSLNSIKDIIVAAFVFVADRVMFLVNGVIDSVLDAWDTFGGTITAVFSLIWGTITNVIKTAFGVIAGILDIFAGIFTGDWGRIWGGVQKIFVSVWDGVKTAFANAINAIVALMPGFLKDWLGIKDEIGKSSADISASLDDVIKSHGDVEEATGKTKTASEKYKEATDAQNESTGKSADILDGVADSGDKLVITLNDLGKEGLAAKNQFEKLNPVLRDTDAQMVKTAEKNQALREEQKKLDDNLIKMNKNLRQLPEGMRGAAEATSSTKKPVVDLRTEFEKTADSMKSWSSFLTSEGGLSGALNIVSGKLFGKGGLSDAIGGVGAALTGGGGLSGAVGSVATSLLGSGGLGSAVSGVAGLFGGDMMGAVSGLANLALPGLGTALGAIGPVLDALGINMDEVLGAIGDKVAGVGRAIGGAVTGALSAVGKLFGAGKEAEKERQRQTRIAAKAQAIEVFKSSDGAFYNSRGWLDRDKFMTALSQAGIEDMLKGAGITFADFVSDILAGMNNSITDVVNDLVGAVRSRMPNADAFSIFEATAIGARDTLQRFADARGVDIEIFVDAVRTSLGLTEDQSSIGLTEDGILKAFRGAIEASSDDPEKLNLDTQGAVDKNKSDRLKAEQEKELAGLVQLNDFQEQLIQEVNNVLNGLFTGEENHALAMQAKEATSGLGVLGSLVESLSLPSGMGIGEAISETMMLLQSFAQSAMSGISGSELQSMFGNDIQSVLDDIQDGLSSSLESQISQLIQMTNPSPGSLGSVNIPDNSNSGISTQANVNVFVDGELIGKTAAKNIGSVLDVNAFLG